MEVQNKVDSEQRMVQAINTVLREAGTDLMVLQDAGIDPNSPEPKFSRWIQGS